jgi:hypothetical protein
LHSLRLNGKVLRENLQLVAIIFSKVDLTAEKAFNVAKI